MGTFLCVLDPTDDVILKKTYSTQVLPLPSAAFWQIFSWWEAWKSFSWPFKSSVLHKMLDIWSENLPISCVHVRYVLDGLAIVSLIFVLSNLLSIVNNYSRSLLREIRKLKVEHDQMLKNTQQSSSNPDVLSELKVLRQRKDELEMRMSALQETRRELMVQLEGLMKLLKVLLAYSFGDNCALIVKLPCRFDLNGNEKKTVDSFRNKYQASFSYVLRSS